MAIYTLPEVHDQLSKLIDLTHEIPGNQPMRTHPRWQEEIDRTREMVNNCPDMEESAWRYVQMILYAVGVDTSEVH